MNSWIDTIPDMRTDSAKWGFSYYHEFRAHSSSSGSRLISAEFIYVTSRQLESFYSGYSRRAISVVTIYPIGIGDEVEFRCFENSCKKECVSIIIFSSIIFVDSGDW